MVLSRIGEPVSVSEVHDLSPGDRVRFKSTGFLTIESLLTPAEVDATRALVVPLLDAPEPRDEGMLYDYSRPGGDPEDPKTLQLLLPFDYAPALFDGPFFRAGAALAGALLGPELRYRGSHYVQKPPRGDNPTPFHQDEAFWDPGALHEAIAIWLPFDDVRPEHGPLQFVPRPIDDPRVFEHRHIGADPRIHGLELIPGELNVDAAVSCPVAKGAATVHHCRCVHGAGPNRAARAREVLVLNFARPPTPLPAPRDFPWQRATDNPRHRIRRRCGIELP